MALKSETLEKTRALLLALTGLACLTYAALALLQGRPDPIYWWIPGLTGVGATLGITLAFLMAGREAGSMAKDELYHSTTKRAAAASYWVTLVLFALMGFSAARQLTDWPTSYAVVGTLTGASYLFLFVYFDWRAGR